MARTTVRGDIEINVFETVREYDLVECACTIRCASGVRSEGKWRGIPFSELLEDVDPEATHLLVESRDGYRACIALTDVFDGVLAMERLDTGSKALPRVVAPAVEGSRLVKHVDRIETCRLPPGSNPKTLDRLGLETTKK